MIAKDLYSFASHPLSAFKYADVAAFSSNSQERLLARTTHSRERFTLAHVKSQDICITGGLFSEFTTNSAVKFSLETNEFTELASMNEARSNHGSASLSA